MKDYKLVKCYLKNDSFTVMFDFGLNGVHSSNDKTGYIFEKSSFQKIEPLEQNDTLQEVVDWCKDQEEKYICIDGGLRLRRYSDDKIVSLFNDSVECLQHIRKPEYEENEFYICDWEIMRFEAGNFINGKGEIFKADKFNSIAPTQKA